MDTALAMSTAADTTHMSGGNVSIEVTGGKKKTAPMYMAAEKDIRAKGNAVVGKDVSIKLDGVKNDVYALGKYSSVSGKGHDRAGFRRRVQGQHHQSAKDLQL